MKKQLVAFTLLQTQNGQRTYGAINKDGKLLETVKVYDCGHGAQMAFASINSKYKISDAAWTHLVSKQFKDKHEKIPI